jgi:hypothetical protein
VARQKLISRKERHKEQYDKRKEPFQLNVGQQVLHYDEAVHRGRSKKLSPQYIRHYEVLSINGGKPDDQEEAYYTTSTNQQPKTFLLTYKQAKTFLLSKWHT